jgi:glutaredoxin-like protein
MALLNEQIRENVAKMLADLKDPVTLKVFTQELECQYCRETRELAEEVAGVSDKVSVEVYDFEADKLAVDEVGIDKIPAIAVVGAKDYGVRLYGIPSGYEFGTLIEDIRMVSEGDSGLSEATREMVARLTKPVRIQVFTTPT